MNLVNNLPYTTVVQVAMTGNTGRFPLPDNELLRGRHIIGLYLRKQDGSDSAVDINNNVLVGEAAVRAMTINLQVDSTNVIADTPLETFYTTDFRLYVGLDLYGFNPQKSYVQVNNTANVTAGEVVELVFVYQAGNGR